MDGVSRRGVANRGRRPIQRTKRAPRSSGGEEDRRRLIQLVASFALFLLVYIGRGVFPGQLEAWREAAAANVDFKAAFQQFSTDLSQGKPMQSAIETLCFMLLGGELEERPPYIPLDEKPQALVLLSQTPNGGLDYLREHGILAGTSFSQKEDERSDAEQTPTQPDPPMPEETQPVVVTAVAQAYTDDGIELPRNVSMAFYELGLSETAVPVAGTATSGFGYRDSPINGKHEFHLALDIGAAEGTEIGAFASGVVEYIGESDEFGNYLKIRHENNVSSFYAHCSKLLVHKGDEVSCGQTVALVGHTGNATGPHLHLTIEKDNIRLDPAYYVELP